jgi:hypothetical protein
MRPVEVDHVVAEKHGGPTTAANLAAACYDCNRAKGSDVASVEWAIRSGVIDWPGTLVVRLFNPRLDYWSAHFSASVAADEVWIDPLTPVGRVTVRLLGLNDPVRRSERGASHIAGRYPLPTTETP